MPFQKRMVVVEGAVFVPPDEDDHPEHPIYIPIEPPPDSGLSPEHPIYIPVYPDNSLPGDQPRPDNSLPGDQPGVGVPEFPTPPIYIPIPVPPDSGLSPEHPIYLPVYPDNSLPGDQPIVSHPIELPPPPEFTGEKLKALCEFIFGNLPTDPSNKPQPVKGKRR